MISTFTPRRCPWVAAAGLAALTVFSAPSQASFLFNDLLLFKSVTAFGPVEPVIGGVGAGVWQGNFLETGEFSFLKADHTLLPVSVSISNIAGPPPDLTDPSWGAAIGLLNPGGAVPLQTFLLDANDLGHFSYNTRMTGLIGSALVTLPVAVDIDFTPPQFGGPQNDIAVSLRLIPEPAGAALLAIAGMALLWTRRRPAAAATDSLFNEDKVQP